MHKVNQKSYDLFIRTIVTRFRKSGRFGRRGLEEVWKVQDFENGSKKGSKEFRIFFAFFVLLRSRISLRS